MRDLDAVDVAPRRRSRALAIVAAAALAVGVVVVRAYLTAPRAPVKPSPVAATPTPTVVEAVDLQFISALDGFVETYEGEPARLYETADGGQTWSLLYEGPRVGFRFFDPQHGLVWSERAGLMSTADGGRSWSSVGRLPQDVTVVAFASARVGVAVAALASNPVSGRAATLLYRTSDGGHSWLPATLHGTDPAGPFDLGMAGATGLLLSRVGATTSVFMSQDGGATWFQVRPPAPPSEGLVATRWHAQANGEEVVLTTEWVNPTRNVGAPSTPVGTGLYSLGADGRWRATQLPKDPFVDQLQVLDSTTMVGFDHARGFGVMSRDGGLHWTLMTLPAR